MLEVVEEIRSIYVSKVGYLPYVGIYVPKDIEVAKTGYYIDATNLFPNRKFLIFSEDIEFTKTYFEGDKFAFDDSENNLERLTRLASCDGIITGGDFFSWFAAFLSPTFGTKIYPKLFLHDKIKAITPKDWIQS